MYEVRSMTRHFVTARPDPKLLSVVFPIYSESEVLPFVEKEVTAFLGTVSCACEVVLVNDGSTDDSLDKLAAWADRDTRVTVVQLSRNFGHQIAATAGLDHARGDAVVLMDADLQDPLAVIHQMIARYREGYDVVYGQRMVRGGEGLFKRGSAWLFYRIMHLLVYPDLPVDTGDFRLVSKECLDQLLQMRECHRFLRGMVTWVGFPQIAVQYVRNPRAAGTTKYPLRKMLRFAWTAATSFSTIPLNLSFMLGGAAGLFAAEEFIRAFITAYQGHNVPGWTSLMVLTSAIGSAILLLLGVIGQYVGKTYEQSKDRPLYLVSRMYRAGESAVRPAMRPRTGTARENQVD